MSDINVIPNELIEIVYQYLTMLPGGRFNFKDVISLASTCHRLHDAVPKEQLRLVNVMKLYNTAGIIAAIKNMKYYIAGEFIYKHSLFSEKSILIIHDRIILYELGYYVGRERYTSSNWYSSILSISSKKCLWSASKNVTLLSRGCEVDIKPHWNEDYMNINCAIERYFPTIWV